MIRQGRFGTFEAVTILLWPTLAKIYLSFSTGIIQENYSAAWLGVFLGCLIAFFWFLPLAALLKRFPGEDLVSIAENVTGPVIGKILSGVMVLYFFISTTLLLRQIAETVIGTALPMIPLTVIIITFTLVMLLPSVWGLESAARVSALITPYLLAGGIVLFLLQSGNMNPNYLAPLWGPGISKLMINGFFRSSILSELVFLGFLAPSLPKLNPFKTGLILITVATVLLTGAMMVTQMVFPPPVAAEHTYPFYEMARSIYFGRFYQRIEFLFILVWITMVLFSLSLRFYFTTVGLAKIFRMPYYQPLLGMTALAILAVALLYPDYTATVYLDNLFRGRWAWVPAFLVPASIYLAAVSMGKRGKSNA